MPKTIDNDLPHTDHCPGYGSVIKYNAATVLEVAADISSMATDDGACVIIEVMGRAAGWIAAGTVLAAENCPSGSPQIILLPEIAFDQQKFLDKLRNVIAGKNFAVVVVGEGLKDAAGKEVAADTGNVDSFGHPVLLRRRRLSQGDRRSRIEDQDPDREARLRAARCRPLCQRD